MLFIHSDMLAVVKTSVSFFMLIKTRNKMFVKYTIFVYYNNVHDSKNAFPKIFPTHRIWLSLQKAWTFLVKVRGKKHYLMDMLQMSVCVHQSEETKRVQWDGMDVFRNETIC